MLLIGQIWTSTVSFYYVTCDSGTEFVEHSTDDSEHEKEDNKEEKDNKIQNGLNLSHLYKDLIRKNQFEDLPFSSMHDPEINTPPPEFYC